MGDEDAILAALRSAMDSEDGVGVELALYQAYSAGLTPPLAPALIELIGATYHRRHEDVAFALQQLRPREAVQALHRAALDRHEYLEYDEHFGLARKCTWALADIGTPEAKAALVDLASADNEVIAGYAQKRLDRWERELHRKRGSGKDRS